MNDREILAQMIRVTACIGIEQHYKKKKVTLNEDKTDDSSVTILNIPEDAVVIKLDAFSSPDYIFKGEHGECKRADYVIICPDKKRILCIEIKKTTNSWRQIVEQLAGAKCFVAYCQEIGKAFWKEKSFLDGYKHRFIKIGHISIDKRKTRFDKINREFDSPENAMKIDWPKNLQFNELAGP